MSKKAFLLKKALTFLKSFPLLEKAFFVQIIFEKELSVEKALFFEDDNSKKLTLKKLQNF